MDCSDSLKSWSIDESHGGKRFVHALQLDMVLIHLRLELFEVEFGSLRLAAPCKPALAVDDFLIALLAINFVIDLILVIRQQRDVDFPLSTDHDRLCPDGVM